MTLMKIFAIPVAYLWWLLPFLAIHFLIRAIKEDSPLSEAVSVISFTMILAYIIFIS